MRHRRLIPARMAGVLVVALASATVLAACSTSSTGNTATGNGNHGTGAGTGAVPLEPSQFGMVPPAAADTGKSATITVANLTSAAPNWIFPVVPNASGSVYDQYQFIQESWRPLIVDFNGVHPEVSDQFSLANAPVYSNGNQTVTVTLKSNYKWSDGQPVTSQDALFWYYMAKAAVAENP